MTSPERYLHLKQQGNPHHTTVTTWNPTTYIPPKRAAPISFGVAETEYQRDKSSYEELKKSFSFPRE